MFTFERKTMNHFMVKTFRPRITRLVAVWRILRHGTIHFEGNYDYINQEFAYINQEFAHRDTKTYFHIFLSVINVGQCNKITKPFSLFSKTK
jgi:hypothetical protein